MDEIEVIRVSGVDSHIDLH